MGTVQQIEMKYIIKFIIALSTLAILYMLLNENDEVQTDVEKCRSFFT